MVNDQPYLLFWFSVPNYACLYLASFRELIKWALAKSYCRSHFEMQTGRLPKLDTNYWKIAKKLIYSWLYLSKERLAMYTVTHWKGLGWDQETFGEFRSRQPEVYATILVNNCCRWQNSNQTLIISPKPCALAIPSLSTFRQVWTKPKLLQE